MADSYIDKPGFYAKTVKFTLPAINAGAITASQSVTADLGNPSAAPVLVVPGYNGTGATVVPVSLSLGTVDYANNTVIVNGTFVNVGSSNMANGKEYTARLLCNYLYQ